ncbi:MAG: hypothetical protein RML46_05680 [Anaerolineae bacterium]|nr:hypothetical protein [Anaerolineae bacterium]MDW8068382.1 hypothetical protein [Anaerolineae bacterium]
MRQKMFSLPSAIQEWRGREFGQTPERVDRMYHPRVIQTRWQVGTPPGCRTLIPVWLAMGHCTP